MAVPQAPLPQLGRPEGGWLWFLGGVFLLGAGLFSLPNYHCLLAQGGVLDRSLVHPLLLPVGFVLLLLFFRASKQSGEEGIDVPKTWVWACFVLFTGLCFFSRFYRPEDAPPYFFVDQLMVTGDIRSAMDFGHYSLIFPYGSPQPFARYLEVALWKLFPEASGIWVNRLTAAVIDVGILWSLYFLGAGVRSRLAGLIMMSFWALSLFGITWAISGYGASSVILAVALAVLACHKLVEKPTFARFLIWGASLAFGDYTYAPFRPFTPAILTLALLWVLFASGEKPKGLSPWILALGCWTAWLLVFFHTNNFLHHDRLTTLINGAWFLKAAGLGLLAAYAAGWRKKGESEANRRVLGWALGVGFTGLLMAPLMFHPLYSAYMFNRSIFLIGDDIAGGSVPRAIWENIVYAFRIFFSTSEADFSRYPIPGHSFFEAVPQTALLVGAALFLAKPSWRKTFILTMALVGAVPFILCQRPHTGRLFGMIVPLFLMAAWGVETCWVFVSRNIRSSRARELLLLGLVLFWAWDAKSSWGLYREWAVYRTTNDAVLGAQLERDWRRYRVLIARHDPNFFQPQFTMLCDQKEAWLLDDPNPIYLGPGEISKDIALYVFGGDAPLADRIRSEFPGARWEDVASLNGPDFMHRIIIPAADLVEGPGKRIFITRVPGGYWERRFYWADYPYGLARGLIWKEDRVPNLRAALPPGVDVHVTMQAAGEEVLPVDGDYHLSIKEPLDVVELEVDGKTILRQDSGQPLSVKVHLKAGRHRVSYKTAFRSRYDCTLVYVTPPGGGPSWVLGDPH